MVRPSDNPNEVVVLELWDCQCDVGPGWVEVRVAQDGTLISATGVARTTEQLERFSHATEDIWPYYEHVTGESFYRPSGDTSRPALYWVETLSAHLEEPRVDRKDDDRHSSGSGSADD